MHLRLSHYSAFVALLSLASAACLMALAMRYAAAHAQFPLSLGSCAFLALPSVICAAIWIRCKNSFLRAAGCCVSLLLFAFCARSLLIGPVGGDMDFGASFVAGVAAMGCVAVSVVAAVLAGGLSLAWEQVHEQ